MDGKDSPAIASVYEVDNVVGAQQISVGDEHACATIVDGTVSCWGNNDWGQLGDGTTNTPANAISGVTVKGLSGAVQVAGYFLSTCALDASGQIFCWGENSRGELGDGHAEEEGQEQQIFPNLPVVGISTAKTLVPRGYYDACAILADSTARCWGSNDEGVLGDGTTITRFAPVMPAF
jgi:alpha-tubulin suppressor-like RCC1 family protein